MSCRTHPEGHDHAAVALSGEETRALAEEEAALRRVATLVARGVSPDELFAAVAGEAGRVLSAGYAHLGRYGPDDTLHSVAAWGAEVASYHGDSRWSPGETHVATLVFETGRPARLDGHVDASGALGGSVRDRRVGSTVGAPVVVEGRLWGIVVVGVRGDQSMLAGAEALLMSFTELVATAIANAEGRAALARLAEEQAALRQVATLVARGMPPNEVFAAVTGEAGQLLGAQLAGMGRYEGDNTLTMLSTWGAEGAQHPLIPGPWPLEGGDLASMIWRTGRPVWIEDYSGVPGPIAAFVRERLRIGSSIASPIVVEGRLWGVLFLHSKRDHPPFPRDAESRLTGFTELAATAIANVESHAALAASRARIVAAGDEARRRIERDLHDGTQQQLVSLMLELQATQVNMPPELGELRSDLSRIASGLTGVFDRVREISRGIHPAVLSERGLRPALRSLARQSPVPVELDLRAGRLPGPVEVAAYYVVSEALANTAKHAHASAVHVVLGTHSGSLQLAVSDDGVGGADRARGSGLVGLCDRIEALGGTLNVTSPAGGGTTLLIMIPITGQEEAVTPTA